MSTDASTPSFDRLYDSARRLQGIELVLELRDSPGTGAELWLVLRALDGGRPVHERRADGSVDAAAVGVIEAVEADAADF